MKLLHYWLLPLVTLLCTSCSVKMPEPGQAVIRQAQQDRTAVYINTNSDFSSSRM